MDGESWRKMHKSLKKEITFDRFNYLYKHLKCRQVSRTVFGRQGAAVFVVNFTISLVVTFKAKTCAPLVKASTMWVKAIFSDNRTLLDNGSHARPIRPQSRHSGSYKLSAKKTAEYFILWNTNMAHNNIFYEENNLSNRQYPRRSTMAGKKEIVCKVQSSSGSLSDRENKNRHIQCPMNCRKFYSYVYLIFITLFAVQYLDSRPPRRARRDQERVTSEPKWRKYHKSTATMCGDILADCRQWSHDFGSLVVECQYRSKRSANQSLIYRLQSHEHSAEVTFIDNTCDTSIQVEP